MIQIQATFAGYGGQPCTIFSVYDADSRVLVIAKEVDYRLDRRKDSVVLTNVPDIPRDSLFVPSELMPAIAAFYAMKGGMAADGKSARLTFGEGAIRANPENSIEKDGIETSGPKYRISEAVTCAQIAALATCMYAMRCDTVERTVRMAESFKHLSMGGILTI